MAPLLLSFYGNPQSIEDIPIRYVNDLGFRQSILAMHRAVTQLKYWEQMKLDPTGGNFIFSDDYYVKEIGEHPLVKQSGHTGTTFGLCMRVIQKIARDGWDGYVNSFTIIPLD